MRRNGNVGTIAKEGIFTYYRGQLKVEGKGKLRNTYGGVEAWFGDEYDALGKWGSMIFGLCIR
jgi:hypothetical protein